MPNNHTAHPPLTRREFVAGVGRGACLLALGGAAGVLASKATAGTTVWQIDPWKCTQCSRCATECVLDFSAVKCVQDYPICGYCRICFGYFHSRAGAYNSAAENQMCPTGAISRRFVHEPYFEYNIDESLCNGCSKCVKGCAELGNGSFYLQVRHDRCLNCNECAIAQACPADAFVRLPAAHPYAIKSKGQQEFARFLALAAGREGEGRS